MVKNNKFNFFKNQNIKTNVNILLLASLTIALSAMVSKTHNSSLTLYETEKEQTHSIDWDVSHKI